MGNLLSRQKKEFENLQIHLQLLELENKKLKSELIDIEDKLQNYITLSNNLQDRLTLENSFWDMCDYTPTIKDDHNNFINSHYIDMIR